MQKFKLCYQTPESKELYIVPSLLPGDPPLGYKWAEQSLLQTHYQYTFMPKGIMSRLIVWQHALLESRPVVWKRGAVFYAGNARAEVVESYREKRIKIRVNNNSRAAKELLQNIVRDLNNLNSGFHFNERMRVEQEIPCCCAVCKSAETPTYFKRRDLDQAGQDGKPVYCMKSYELIPVQQILDGIFPEEEGAGRKRKKPVLDKAGIKDLLEHAKLEKALQQIEAFDEDAAILLSARIADIRKKTSLGVASSEQETLIRQQCIKTVLDWLKEQ